MRSYWGIIPCILAMIAILAFFLRHTDTRRSGVSVLDGILRGNIDTDAAEKIWKPDHKLDRISANIGDDSVQ